MSAKRRSVRRAYARSRTRVGGSAQRRLESSPYRLGNASGPIAVTKWISKLTCACQVSARRRSIRRACARVVLFCIVQNRKVAMLPWKLKWPGPLAVTEWVSKLTCDFQMSAKRRSVRRLGARARIGSCVLCRIEKSPCCLGNASGPLAVADWISKLTCVLQMSARRRSVRRARARVGSCVLRRFCAE